MCYSYTIKNNVPDNKHLNLIRIGSLRNQSQGLRLQIYDNKIFSFWKNAGRRGGVTICRREYQGGALITTTDGFREHLM